MPQGKLFMDKQNLSLQRQKQSRSSWKEISWCSVNNSLAFLPLWWEISRTILNYVEAIFHGSTIISLSVAWKWGAIERGANCPPAGRPPRSPRQEVSSPPHCCAWTGKLMHRAHQGPSSCPAPCLAQGRYPAEERQSFSQTTLQSTWKWKVFYPGDKIRHLPSNI